MQVTKHTKEVSHLVYIHQLFKFSTTNNTNVSMRNNILFKRFVMGAINSENKCNFVLSLKTLLYHTIYMHIRKTADYFSFLLFDLTST